jgi:hypothetical protein
MNQRSEGDMQRDAWYWGRTLSNPPPGCLWRLWRSASTLTERFRPDGNIFCWCPSECNINRSHAWFIHIDCLDIDDWYVALLDWIGWSPVTMSSTLSLVCLFRLLVLLLFWSIYHGWGFPLLYAYQVFIKLDTGMLRIYYKQKCILIEWCTCI